MVPYRYEEISHTADLALRVWGENFHDMLRHAAEGMYALMGAGIKKSTSSEESFTIADASHEEILVDFLNELLFIFEVHGRALDEFQFKNSAEGLSVQAVGHPVDRIQRAIKAVTFHDLKVGQSNRGFETIITFDV